MKTITSADNPQFKMLLRLMQSSRERRLAGLSLLDGTHLLQAYLAHAGMPQQVVLSKSGLSNAEIRSLLDRMAGTPQVLLSDGLFRQLSSVATPTGVITVIETPRRETPPADFDSCVMLEDLQDPGNLGSIMRSCAAAAIRQVFLSRDSVNAWSPRVMRAAMGAHFGLEVYERMDLPALAQRFSGRVLATSRSAHQSLYESDLTGKIAFVFGNEGAGISPALIQYTHGQITIPMSAVTESLNVAAAAAICLFERVRQLQ